VRIDRIPHPMNTATPKSEPAAPSTSQVTPAVAKETSPAFVQATPGTQPPLSIADYTNYVGIDRSRHPADAVTPKSEPVAASPSQPKPENQQASADAQPKLNPALPSTPARTAPKLIARITVPPSVDVKPQEKSQAADELLDTDRSMLVSKP